ncbi:MAG: recombination mediator RecR [Planctomycetes bacterium]|jgi:recombination protein RecR|nr:recombination mediator RecR [Planctomycetota bacterium]
MAQGYSEPVERLLSELSKLPGVGQRTAERLAYHLLRQSPDEAMKLAIAIRDVKKLVKPCGVCGNPDETDPCRVCADPERDRSVILVVETPKDLAAIERCGAYRGVYHVLGGRIAPLDGLGPEDLRLAELTKRIGPEVREVVLGTNPDLEGDGTALYLRRILTGKPVKLSRLARGLPAGSSIEYASGAVLAEAVSRRTTVD